MDLDPETVAVLRQHRKDQAARRLLLGARWADEDLVFTAVDGRALRPDAVSKAFAGAVARSGLPRIRQSDTATTVGELISSHKNLEMFHQCPIPLNMAPWGFLTNHARVLLYIAHDPETRLRHLAAALDITERTAYGIVADLVEAGYVVKEKVGRRNRYGIEKDLPPVRHPRELPAQEAAGEESETRETTIGELLDLLSHAKRPQNRRPKGRDQTPR